MRAQPSQRVRALVVLATVVASPAFAGEIKGVVKYDGTAPKLEPFKATRDQNVCGPAVPNESVAVSNGHLANVVVTVAGTSLPKPAPRSLTIDQHECRYHPHVQAAPAGSTLDILNSDPMLHNIHGRMGTQTLFNLAMPLKGQKIPRRLPTAGLVDIKCDVHSWMQGYVIVTDEPSAVSGADGAFEIKDLPAGTYTVSAWQETLGKKSQQVNVPATGTASVDFVFGPKSASR
jgi:plastocyanin